MNILSYLKKINTTSKQAIPNQSLNVLDYGCGWGDFMYMAQSDGVDLVGIEINEEKIDFCKKRHLEVVKSVQELPENTHFDIFYSDQVFEHLPNLKTHLEQIKKYLSKNFIGFIGVPNYTHAKITMSKDLLKAGKLANKDLITWDHLNYFSPNSLKYFLESNGFEIFNIITGEKIEEPVNTNLFFRFRTGNTVKKKSKVENQSYLQRIIKALKGN